LAAVLAVASLPAVVGAAAAGDGSPPSIPQDLTALAAGFGRIDLSWSASADDQGVDSYAIYRRRAYLTSVDGSTTSFADMDVAPSTIYSYSVEALDAAGHRSGRSEPAAARTAHPVIAAAGDVACDPASPYYNDGNGTPDRCRQKYTADLLTAAPLAAVLAIGDLAYECGGLEAFQRSYGPSWGQVKPITRPIPGNHEYQRSGGTDCSAAGDAAGYFDYFGALAGNRSRGYYSFDVGRWHVIALNSECYAIRGGCGEGSPQETWLRADLLGHPARCTLAYWHEPRFTSGGSGGDGSTSAFWEDLYEAGAEVILAGHDHIYERFARQAPNGSRDPSGVRQFTVGTGGKSHGGIFAIAPNSRVRNANTFGILKLTLRPFGYDWNFVPEAEGTFTDSGKGSCH
jgi:calcineurin-like phosphoesterase family protein